MKKLLLTTLLLLGISSLQAKSLVVSLTNGALVYYLIGGETNPMMRFTEDRVFINGNEYEFSKIQYFYISETDDPNGLGIAPKSSVVEYREEGLLIRQSQGSEIAVYSLDGKAVAPAISVRNGERYVDLSSQPSGVYVVKVGEDSFKFVKK